MFDVMQPQNSAFPNAARISASEKPMGALSLIKCEWPTRIALILQGLAMGAVVMVVLTILFA